MPPAITPPDGPLLMDSLARSNQVQPTTGRPAGVNQVARVVPRDVGDQLIPTLLHRGLRQYRKNLQVTDAANVLGPHTDFAKQVSVIRNGCGAMSNECVQASITKLANFGVREGAATFGLGQLPAKSCSIPLLLDAKAFQTAPEVLKWYGKPQVEMLKIHRATTSAWHFSGSAQVPPADLRDCADSNIRSHGGASSPIPWPL